MRYSKKTHTCGELTRKDVGRQVTLMGWVHTRRDHGGLIFVDLRDREGITQIVFNPEVAAEAHKAAGDIRSEFVLAVTGKASPRPENTANVKLPTGEIEIMVTELTILNTAKTPPFMIEEGTDVAENLRLKYRYLDLRRPSIQKVLITRHKITRTVRGFLDGHGFIDVETPFLTKRTPEGARDYLVPSRVNPGAFFALPQSPQLFKQILMVAGFERYYQIVKCLRPRPGRSTDRSSSGHAGARPREKDEEVIMKTTRTLLVVSTLSFAAAAAWAIDIEGTAVVVPVAMHGPGALGTSWRTDLWISNWTMGRQEVTATFYRTGGEPLTTTFDVGSADTVELRDVVLSTFGLANAKGMILLTVDTPMGFQATARIYNVGNPIGEFGQFVPGIAIARLERQAFVAGLAGVDGSAGNRSSPLAQASRPGTRPGGSISATGTSRESSGTISAA